jgi:hypothetical protein
VGEKEEREEGGGGREEKEEEEEEEEGEEETTLVCMSEVIFQLTLFHMLCHDDNNLPMARL